VAVPFTMTHAAFDGHVHDGGRVESGHGEKHKYDMVYISKITISQV